jgi:hypothetical protein
MPGGGNCMPPGGEGPPGGANPGGRPCGRAGIPVAEVRILCYALSFRIFAYQAGSWACPAEVQILVADLVGEVACLRAKR